ncbi:MAG: hypothetical protein K6E86_00110 [Bacteroidales bacterium]|nr:hypothetical protein [Bacteroidales bacterium]
MMMQLDQTPMLDGILGHCIPLDLTADCTLPYCENSVQAGMAVTRVSDEHQTIDLSRLLDIEADHFCTHVRGDSMEGACIHSGDLLIARKCAQAEEGQIVIAEIDCECTVKQYHYDPDLKRVVLLPRNPNYSPIVVRPDQSFLILGVVEKVIKTI